MLHRMALVAAEPGGPILFCLQEDHHRCHPAHGHDPPLLDGGQGKAILPGMASWLGAFPADACSEEVPCLHGSFQGTAQADELDPS